MRQQTASILAFILFFFFLLPLYGRGNPEAKKRELPIVVVSIIPQAYFVERIADDRASVMVLVGPGQSPHTYEPTPKQMTDLGKASVWILSNTDFELSLVPKVRALYPSLWIVDGTEGVHFRTLEAHSHHEEGEEHEGDGHDEALEHGAPGNLDRHTWLGREPALILAGQVRDALIRIDPSSQDKFSQNYLDLTKEIEMIFSELRRDLLALKGQSVFVYHPAFGYFLDEFGIYQEAVETGGKEPGAKTLSELIIKAQEEGAKAIFVQEEFPVAVAKTVADAVGAVVVPLSSLPTDWMANLRIMGEALKKAAKPQP